MLDDKLSLLSISKGGMLPADRTGRYFSGVVDAVVNGSSQVPEHTLPLRPMTLGRMRFVPSEVTHSSNDVRPGAIGSIHEISHKFGVREQLEVKDIIIVLGGCVLGCHGLATGHSKVVEYVRDVLSLAELKGTFAYPAYT